MPRNAITGAGGVRMYSWDEPGKPPVQVLSVTSIRKLAGVNHMLVEWQLGNVTKTAMGIRKQTQIGPRGGVKEVYVKDGPFPGEFIRRMLETEGAQAKLDEVRKWLRATADEPRDIAAVRGTVVHKMIELNTKLDRCDEATIRYRMDEQWAQERRKIKPEITGDDVRFVQNCMRQYWNMRAQMPFVILAQEPQVWNLTAGYAGSADVLLWFLPPSEDVNVWQRQASAGHVDIETIQKVGGRIALGDWKTSKGVYTDHVVQMHAYLGAEFVGSDGRRDERLTPMLEAMMEAVLIHIRPNGVTVDFAKFTQPTMHAFLGSVAFARFLAMNPTPQGLFSGQVSFVAPDTEESHEEDDAA